MHLKAESKRVAALEAESTGFTAPLSPKGNADMVITIFFFIEGMTNDQAHVNIRG
jgi:hypothetical protein